MNYEAAKSRVFVTGRIPEGYFGDTVEVGFALIGNAIVTVAPCGAFHTAGLPPAMNEAEALWLLRSHPNSRATKLAESAIN